MDVLLCVYEHIRIVELHQATHMTFDSMCGDIESNLIVGGHIKVSESLYT